MKDLKQEKDDLVSAILDNTDLLNTFADSLKTPEAPLMTQENLITTEKGQRIKYFVWKKIKEFLSFALSKIQTLAVLAEYNFKNLEKKIQMSIEKK